MRAIVTLVDAALEVSRRALTDAETKLGEGPASVRTLLSTGAPQKVDALAKEFDLDQVPHADAMDGLLFLRVCMDRNIDQLHQATNGELDAASVLKFMVADLERSLIKLERAWRFYEPLPLLVRIGFRKPARYGSLLH